MARPRLPAVLGWILGLVGGLVLLGIAVVAWFIWAAAGGSDRTTAERAVAGRGRVADQPVESPAGLRLLLPAGWVLREGAVRAGPDYARQGEAAPLPLRPGGSDADPDTVFITADLGRYQHIGGSSDSGRIEIALSERPYAADLPTAALVPNTAVAWSPAPPRDGLDVLTLETDLAVRAAAVDRARGRRVEVLSLPQLYSVEEAVTIALGVARSLAPDEERMDALRAAARAELDGQHARIQANLALLAARLVPLGTALEEPVPTVGGGFLVRQMRDGSGIRVGLPVGRFEAGADAAAFLARRVFVADRLPPALPRESGGSNVPHDLVLTLRGPDGTLLVYEVATGREVTWGGSLPEGLGRFWREATPPGSAVAWRYGYFWNLRQAEAATLTAWLDATAALAAAPPDWLRFDARAPSASP